MTFEIDEIMNSYASILEKSNTDATKEVSQWHTIDLIPNTVNDLVIEASPVFLTSSLLAVAADEDIKILKEKKLSMEPEDMIDRAHPGSHFTADADGEGGLVETQNEQQEKIIQMINKMPNGAPTHIYAYLIEGLSKIAEDMESEGLDDHADIISKAMFDIDTAFKKKANPLAIGIAGLAAVLGLGAGAYSLISGVREGLVIDTKDLLDNMSSGWLGGWMNDPEYASYRVDVQDMYKAAQSMNIMAGQILHTMAQAAKTNDPELAQTLQSLEQQFGQALNVAKTKVEMLQQLSGGGKTGADFIRTKGLIDDIEEDFRLIVSNAGIVRNKVEQYPGQDAINDARIQHHQHAERPTTNKPSVPDNVRIKEVQSFLNKYFYTNSPTKLAETGILDDETKDALEEVSIKITKKLGTSVPTPIQLEQADANKLRLLFQFARQPETNPLTGEPVFK